MSKQNVAVRQVTSTPCSESALREHNCIPTANTLCHCVHSAFCQRKLGGYTSLRPSNGLYTVIYITLAYNVVQYGGTK